ncbi:hypothetical protein A256_17966 [Pseudomonas syringae pv. actinidiae ICMP 19103]|uniref:hypothetical protein n=1 Tax=Pseudomonas syringae TaxID=317 RepID=UPI00035741DB|nr:hypothetical protein [Pseudomonas syringae]EPM50547.1 hypothetical protein A256_17966 [Pseudomonas syringae pv. actinidiae ICMP 19103]EPN02528.1 hypothetical protein A253_18048 [Pseudomonas syringae pv. actinidiae ICMP 19102]
MGGRIIVESVAGCSWNGWPDDRGIRNEGVTTIINEFTTSAARAAEWIRFYTGNSFTGTLILITTDIDGIKAKRRVVLDR